MESWLWVGTEFQFLSLKTTGRIFHRQRLVFSTKHTNKRMNKSNLKMGKGFEYTFHQKIYANAHKPMKKRLASLTIREMQTKNPNDILLHTSRMPKINDR